MASFDHYYPRLLAAEGGYVHNPADPGGETYRGVARAFNQGWEGWRYVDAAKVAASLKSPVPPAKYAVLNKALAGDVGLQHLIKAFYEAKYWDKLGLDAMANQSVAEQLADHGVNAGTARPGRMLQFCINQLRPGAVMEDGVIGPKTLAAANALDQRALFARIVDLRRAFYNYRAGQGGELPGAMVQVLGRLGVSPNATQAQFLKSWLNRVAAIPFVA